MKKIAVLISGGGTNLQSLIDAVASNEINGEIKLVISNKESAFGLERAKKADIPALFINDENKLISVLKENEIDLVVLAGYLKILSEEFTEEFKNRIINIHPSLIPSFCGVGYYGLKVHQAAIEYGVKLSGATVHFVDEEADTGPIIMQKSVEVYPDDSAEDLQKRVLKVEHEILKKSVSLFCDDKIKLVDRKVFIIDSEV